MIGVLRLKRDIGKKDSYIGLFRHLSQVCRYLQPAGRRRFAFPDQQADDSQRPGIGDPEPELFLYLDIGRRLDRVENGFIYATDYNMNGRHFRLRILDGWPHALLPRRRRLQSPRQHQHHNLFVRYNS